MIGSHRLSQSGAAGKQAPARRLDFNLSTTPVARTAKSKKIRILIADQEGVFRFGLRKLFGVEEDLRVLAQAVDSLSTLNMAKEFTPDIIFLQAELMGQTPGEFMAELHQASPESKVVITASALNEEASLRYVKAGASGVILKSVDPTLFAKCARKVVNDGEVWLPKKQVAQMARLLEGTQERPMRPRDTLTNREKTVISYVMQGWRNKEIAQHLSITEQTVKNHLRTVYDKVGVSDRLELVLYAIHQRLELPPTSPTPLPPTRPASTKQQAVQQVQTSPI
jgi:DNA-binding NarL/FixJ family response regulator